MQGLELPEVERAVVQCAGQAKAVNPPAPSLAGAVAFVHPAGLRHGDVRLIQHQQVILREEVQEGAGARAGRAGGQVPRVILDAGAEPHLLHHLQVVFGAHLDPLRLQQFAVLLEPRDALAQLLPNGQHRRPQLGRGGDELLARVNGHGFQRLQLVAGQRLKPGDALNLVPEELHPQSVLAAGGAELHRIPAHAELAARRTRCRCGCIAGPPAGGGSGRGRSSRPARIGMTIAS